MRDNLEELALKIIEEATEVLETKEVLERLEGNVEDITRTKLFARLNHLRGDGLIKGKFVGPGKGVWVWWNKNSFFNGGENA